jgi:hypothetical protein
MGHAEKKTYPCSFHNFGFLGDEYKRSCPPFDYIEVSKGYVMKIFIIGAGTQGQFVLDVINSIPNLEVGGLYDDRYPEITKINGVPILGKIKETNLSLSPYLSLGIGEPKIRKKILLEKREQGFRFPPVIHPNTVISSLATIEEGVTVGPFSTILYGSFVGKGACILSHVNINQNVSVGPFSLIGAGAIAGNHAELGEGCHIEMGAIIRPKASIPSWTYVT